MSFSPIVQRNLSSSLNSQVFHPLLSLLFSLAETKPPPPTYSPSASSLLPLLSSPLLLASAKSTPPSFLLCESSIHFFFFVIFGSHITLMVDICVANKFERYIYFLYYLVRSVSHLILRK